MRTFRHMFVLGAPLAVFVLTEYLFFFGASTFWLPFFLMILGVIIMALAVVILAHRAHWYEAVSFMITPLFLVWGWFFLLLFLESPFLINALNIVSAVLSAVFLENIFLRYQDPARYQDYTISNISNLVNVYIVFLLSASFYGFTVFLTYPIWLATAVILGTVFLLTYQSLWVVSLTVDKAGWYMIVLPLIFCELYWVTSLWPFSIYVNAFCVSVYYYLLTGLARNHLLGILERKVVLRYIGVALFACLAVLITAKWA